MPGNGETLPPVIAELQANAEDFFATVDEVEGQLEELDAEHADPTVGLNTDDFEAKVAEITGQVAALDAAMDATGVDTDAFGEAMYESGVSAELLSGAADEAGVSLESLVADAAAADAQGLSLGNYLEAVGQGLFQVGEYAVSTDEDLDLFNGTLFDVEASAGAVSLTLEETAADFLAAAGAVNVLEGLLADGEDALQGFEEAADGAAGAVSGFLTTLSYLPADAAALVADAPVVAALIAAIAAAALIAIPTIGALIGEIGAFTAILFPAVAGIGLFAAAVLTSGSNLSALEAPLKAAGKAFDEALKPFVQPALAAGVTLVTGLITAFTPVAEASAEIIGSILHGLDTDLSSSGFATFLTWLTVTMGPALETVAGFIGDVGDAFAEMGENGTGFTSMIEQGIGSLGQDLVNFGKSNTFKDFVTWLEIHGPVIGGDFETIAKDVGKVVVAFAPFGEKLLNVVRDFFNWITPALVALGVALSGPGAAMKELEQAWDSAWGDIKSTFDTVWGALKTALSFALFAPVESAVNTLKSTWDTVWGAIKSTFDTVWGDIKSAITTLGSTIATDITAPINDLKSTWDTVWGDLQGAVSSAKSAIDPILAAISAAIGGVASALNDLKSAESAVSGGLSDIGKAATGGYHVGPIPLAGGGLVSHPTLAIVGEAGPEMIIPESMVPGGFGGGAVQALPSIGGSGAMAQTNHYNFTINGATDPIAVRKEITSFLAANGRALGTSGRYGGGTTVRG